MIQSMGSNAQYATYCGTEIYSTYYLSTHTVTHSICWQDFYLIISSDESTYSTSKFLINKNVPVISLEVGCICAHLWRGAKKGEL